MDRSGHRERRNISIRMVAKVCFFSIILGICWKLFRFLLQTVNVLLVGMLQISVKLQNLLREDNETDEISPENSIVREDSKDDSSNLMNAHIVTDTIPPEMNDNTNSAPFERNEADYIPKDGPEGSETEDIGFKIIHTVAEDFKDDSANLIDPHNVIDTNSTEINDGTRNSAPSKRNVADAPEKDLKNLGDDFKDSAKFIDAHNMTDTNTKEMDDDTTNSTSSTSNGADDVPEEDPEVIETEDISLIVRAGFKDASENLIDPCNVTDTNSPEKEDDTNSTSYKRNMAAVQEKSPEGVETEDIGPINSLTVGDDFKDKSVNLVHVHNMTDTLEVKDDTTNSAFTEGNVFDDPQKDHKDLEAGKSSLKNASVVMEDFKDFAKFIDAHNVTDTIPAETDDDTTNSTSSKSNGADDIPEKDLEDVETEDIGSKNSFIIGSDFNDDSTNLIDPCNVTDTNPPEMKDDTNSASSEKNVAAVPEKNPEDIEAEDIGPKYSLTGGEDFKNDFVNLIDVHNSTDTNTPEMKDDTTNSAFSKRNVIDSPENYSKDLKTEESRPEKSLIVGADFKDDSVNLIDPYNITDTTHPEKKDNTNSTSSEINVAAVPEKNPEDAETEDNGPQNLLTVGEEFKDDSVNLIDVHNMTETNTPEMKEDTINSAFSERNVIDGAGKDLKTEECGPENIHEVGEDFKDDSAKFIDAHHATDTNPTEMNDDIINSTSSESNGVDDVPEEDPEDVEIGDIGSENSLIVGADFKDDSANLTDPSNVTDTNLPEIIDGTTSSAP